MKIHGQLKQALLQRTTTATAGIEGQIIYDTVTKKPKYFEGTWKDFATATASTDYSVTEFGVATYTNGVYFQIVQTNGISADPYFAFESPDNNLVFEATGSRTMGVSFATNPVISGNLTVAGNLEVQGTTTKFNTTEVEIEDVRITLNSNFITGTPSNAVFSGIEVKRGNEPTASLVWLEMFGRWGVSNADFTGYESIPNANDITTISTTVIDSRTIGAQITDLTTGTKTIAHPHNSKHLQVICRDDVTGELILLENTATTTNVTLQVDYPLPNIVNVYIVKLL